MLLPVGKTIGTKHIFFFRKYYFMGDAVYYIRILRRGRDNISH